MPNINIVSLVFRLSWRSIDQPSIREGTVEQQSVEIPLVPETA